MIESGQERWEKQQARPPFNNAGFMLVVREPATETALFGALNIVMPEWLIDRIIADHEQRAVLHTKPWSYEVCADCNENIVAGFRVTDSMWELVVGDSSLTLCLLCFDKRAATKDIAWDKEPIEFHPVSTIANRQWAEIEVSEPYRLTLEAKLARYEQDAAADYEMWGDPKIICERMEAAEAKVADLEQRLHDVWVILETPEKEREKAYMELEQHLNAATTETESLRKLLREPSRADREVRFD